MLKANNIAAIDPSAIDDGLESLALNSLLVNEDNSFLLTVNVVVIFFIQSCNSLLLTVILVGHLQLQSVVVVETAKNTQRITVNKITLLSFMTTEYVFESRYSANVFPKLQCDI